MKLVKKGAYLVKQGWNERSMKVIGSGSIAGGTLVSTSSYAALDPAVATTFTTIQADFTSMMGLVWPVIGAVFAALAIIGLVRAALNRGGIRA